MRSWIVIFVLSCFASVALADGLQVTPVRLTFNDKRTVTSFKVSNLTNKAMLLQSQAYFWTQKKGLNQYQKSDKLFIAPPIAQVPAGKTQLFRVGLKDLKPGDAEQAFRIYIQEVIPQKSREPGTLSFALRIGLPVFIEQSKPTELNLQWRAAKDKKGQLKIGLKNLSKRHVQVTQLRIIAKDKPVLSENTFAYILPQQSRDFTLKVPAELLQKNQSLHLQAVTDSGTIASEIKLSS